MTIHDRANVHNLDRHRALVAASREIPGEIGDIDQADARWARELDRSPRSAALVLVLCVVGGAMLALALIGAATVWSWAASINGEVL